MSTNIKWAYQKRFKEGEVLIGVHTIGYKKGDNGYEIEEEGAQTVKQIFREFIGGATIRQIASRLEKDCIKSPTGKSKWRPATIQNILRNEKYTGNAIMGKTYKPDVLTKPRKKNNGEAPSYNIQNSHPAIISMGTYKLAQAEMEKRINLRSVEKTGDGKYSGLYPLSGLLVCSQCGSKFRRYGRKLADGTNVSTWVCITHQKNKAECQMKPLKEIDVYKAFDRVIERLSGSMRTLIDNVSETIEKAINTSKGNAISDYEEEMVSYQNKILELFRMKRENKISQVEYDEKYKEYSGIVISLQDKQKKVQDKDLKTKLEKERLEQIKEALNNKSTMTTESLLKLLIDCIKVINKHEVEYQFKCGVNVVERL